MALRRALSTVRSLSQLFRAPLCTCVSAVDHSRSPAINTNANVSHTNTNLKYSSQPICRYYSSHDPGSTNDGLAESQQQRRFFPRRAVMYVPASDERKTKKATTLNVDTLVFDLEDGVAANQKEKARHHVQQAILNCRSSSDLPSARSEHVVRINGFESGMLHDDLEAVFCDPSGKCEEMDEVNGFLHAIMLPKCQSVEQLSELDIALTFHRREPDPFTPVKLIIIIESPTGLINLKEICQFGTSSAKHLRLVGVTFGAEDFLARLGGIHTKDANELIFARQSLVTHAKAFGLDAIDLVDTNFKDLDGLKRQSEEGARMGYTGKQVIHPDQVPVVRQAFSPSPERVKWATGLIEAFYKYQKSGKGAFEYEGEMIDRPLLLQAENIVRLQEAISI